MRSEPAKLLIDERQQFARRRRIACGAKYDGRIFAKTGTLRDTSSLAGYVRAQSGRTYAFVVLCEGDIGRARELQDDVVEALVGQ